MDADSQKGREFFARLNDAVPEFKPVYDDIVEYDEGEILHTLILADLARLVLKCASDALTDPAKSAKVDSVCLRTATFLDHALGTKDQDLKVWIYEGFLSGLTQASQQAVDRVVTFFGPNLKHAWTTHFQE